MVSTSRLIGSRPGASSRHSPRTTWHKEKKAVEENREIVKQETSPGADKMGWQFSGNVVINNYFGQPGKQG